MEVIEQIRRERGKVRISLGSEEIIVPLALFRERPLEEGQPLDLEEYDNWLMVRQYRHALDRAVGYLAARAHSCREIEEKLRRVGYRPCTVEMVIYKLQKENLLDDGDFARQWVEARSGRSLGKQRIALELRRKGISAQEAEAALENIDEEEQLSGAVRLVEKNLGRAKPGEDPRKTAARLTAMLARRGYGYDIARQAIEQVMEGMDDA